jgi:hypothetical protein
VQKPWLPLVAAIVVALYGGILRAHVLSGRYGIVTHPAWAHAITAGAPPIARALEPKIYAWPPVANPYVGGDPVNYLRFAREMESFYRGHVREPMFPAIIRVFLWALGNQDIAISFASAAMSTLCVFAIYLLGARVFGPAVGLLGSLGFAIDYEAVSWAPDGWRDDTFTCFVVFCAWGLLRLRQDARPTNAVLAGFTAAGAMLTRITSLSFVLPALLYISIERRADWRPRLRMSALAAGIAVVLTLPYLINCWRISGDPFISINAHTDFYRSGEGIASHAVPMSAVAYVAQKMTRKPIFQIDTAITGLFVFPVGNKWSGFNLWVPGLARWLSLLAIVGLLLWVFHPDGRLLLIVTVSSLVPYAFTWNVPGGGEWRFTMHAYPFYLLASAYAVCWIAERLWLSRRGIAGLRAGWWRSRKAIVGMCAAAACVAVYFAYQALPYFVARESLRYGEGTSIAAGERDDIFFSRGWSASKQDGVVISRVIVGERAAIRFPLPEVRPYLLTLRADPATPTTPGRVALLLNGRLLSRFGLALDPQRVGSYSVTVPADVPRAGFNRLELIADAVVEAGAAGPRFAFLAPATPISLRVWMVRLNPM